MIADQNLVLRLQMSGVKLSLPHMSPYRVQIKFNFALLFSGRTNVDRIRRPPNAFMIFCKEKRSEFASRYPEDTNKEISKR